METQREGLCIRACGVGRIDFPHYLRILVPQDVHFTLEVRPREDASKSLKILEESARIRYGK